MDYRRLIDAFCMYTLISMNMHYVADFDIQQRPYSCEIDQCLGMDSEKLYKMFINKNTKHRCNIKGCQEVLGWDADQKVSLKYNMFLRCMGRRDQGISPRSC